MTPVQEHLRIHRRGDYFPCFQCPAAGRSMHVPGEIAMTIAKCPRCGESLRMGDGVTSITCPTCAARITSKVKAPAFTPPELPIHKTTPRSIARGNPFLWSSIALGLLLIAAVATIAILALRRPDTPVPVVAVKGPALASQQAVPNEPPTPAQSEPLPKQRETPIDKPEIKPAEPPTPLSVPEKKDPPKKPELRQNVREFLKAGAVASEFPYPLKLGDIGRLPSGESRKGSVVHVFQVIDKNTMLVTAAFSETVRGARGNQVVTTYENRPTNVLVKGVSTVGATDRAGFPMPHVLEVTGTTTYKTTLGTRTVFVLEPLDIESATRLWKSLPK